MEKLWINTYQTIIKISHLLNGIIISSGTGFIIAGKLVTNNHVYFSSNTDEIRLETVALDGHTTNINIQISYLEFQSLLLEGVPVDSWDYAIFDISKTSLRSCPSLELCELEYQIEIGKSIALFGFPFTQNNLSMHSGIISSRKITAGINYIQIDASVNSGNSGGPLIDATSGKVIGIVTRKGTGLTAIFEKLKEQLANNLKIVESIPGYQKTEGGFKNSGIGMLGALETIQVQSLQLTNEIERSANVGIGYAFELIELRKHFE